MRNLIAVLVLAFATPAVAAPLTASERADVAAIVQEVLANVEAPSASIAIVRDGELAFADAYGFSDLENRTPATAQTAYGVGSISKQFTAASLMMFVEQGRLDLDRPIAWFDPTLTRATDISLRRILSHTSGYRDFWPQDYVHPDMTQPIDRQRILDRWARVPLDFEPGSQWQYANTNYTIAGLALEQLAGQPLMQFEQEHIFGPLGMTGVTELDTGRPDDLTGYGRWGLGPIGRTGREGHGWMIGVGHLAMRPTDLAIWNISLMRASLLRPESVVAMTTPTPLNEGVAPAGLGLFLEGEPGRRIWTHTGGVAGFTAGNTIFPDENLALTVLTNAEYGDACFALMARLEFRFREQPPKIALVRDTLTAMQSGRLDRRQFTANANTTYTDAIMRTWADSLGPLGPPRLIIPLANEIRGGFSDEAYRVQFAQRTGTIIVRVDPSTGLIEEFKVLFRQP